MEGGGEQGRAGPTSPPHRPFDYDGCTNCGLMKEKSAKSAWSMLAMTSSSGGVSWGWVRVKNLSKFSAPLPHWKRETQEKVWMDGGETGKSADTTGSYPRSRRQNIETPLRDRRHCHVALKVNLGDYTMCTDRAGSCPSSTCPVIKMYLSFIRAADPHTRAAGQ